MGLFDDATRDLVEVARTRMSVHYEVVRSASDSKFADGRIERSEQPSEYLLSVSVCLPEAVRLPTSLVTTTLPPHGSARVGVGALSVDDVSWRVRRWWRPARPRGLVRPPGSATYVDLDPARLLGAGPGLTPSGDDVLAGALVAGHAVDDPRLPGWQRGVCRLLATGRTTPVSGAMLECALEGYATAELADFLEAVCARPVDHEALDRARSRLLHVGHTSGSALMAGALHALTPHATRPAGAAA